MIAQNPQAPPPPQNVHNAHSQYLPQMTQAAPAIGSTLSSNPNPTNYQSSPSQTNGDINANKKQPKEKTPMCQVETPVHNMFLLIN